VATYFKRRVPEVFIARCTARERATVIGTARRFESGFAPIGSSIAQRSMNILVFGACTIKNINGNIASAIVRGFSSTKPFVNVPLGPNKRKNAVVFIILKTARQLTNGIGCGVKRILAKYVPMPVDTAPENSKRTAVTHQKNLS
jgi:hypothetical protein